MNVIRDIVLYQVVWLIAVIAGARGAGWFGLVAAAGVAVYFAKLDPHRIATVLLASLAAWCTDAAIWWFGGVEFADHAPPWLPSPLWMLGLWLNFAVMAGPVMGAFRGRIAISASLGAVGGPLAYVGAAGLHAVAIPRPWTAIPLVALQFAVLVPIMIALSRPTWPAPAVGGFTR